MPEDISIGTTAKLKDGREIEVEAMASVIPESGPKSRPGSPEYDPGGVDELFIYPDPELKDEGFDPDQEIDQDTIEDESLRDIKIRLEEECPSAEELISDRRAERAEMERDRKRDEGEL